MKKYLLLFVIFSLSLSAQTYSITGTVQNPESKSIENATVSLLKQKDSAVINFTGTGRNGSFSLKLPAQKEAVLLQISSDNYKTFSRKYAGITGNIDLGLLKLERDLTGNIEEVTITASPVKIKKDTIEYNASYLKVDPNDKIDELLKQIPGVETDDDGVMTVNGQPVNKILINGKPLFNKDGKIAMETIPANLIQKIQITTSKTKEEELTGRTPKSDSLTVNFNIDERNNKGNIRNFNLGYGTDNRYDVKGLYAKFKQETNFALIAGSNNINISSFSVDGFFQKNNRNNAANGRTASTGILRTSIIGANYADKIGRDLDLDKFSVEYKDLNLETWSKISRSTFLPDYKLDTRTEKSGNSDKNTFDYNTNATLALDKLTSITFSTDFSNSSTDNTTENNTVTLRDDALLNSNRNSTRGNSFANVFKPKIGLIRKFGKPNRSLSASVSNTFSENKNTNYILQETQFYQSPDQNDSRNQLSRNKNSANSFSANAKYYEPVSDSATVAFEINYDLQKLDRDLVVVDFNLGTGEYSDYNTLLSNTLNQNNTLVNAGVSYNLNKSAYNFRVGTNLNSTRLNINSVYNMQEYNFQKNFLLPEYDLLLNYKFNRTTSLRISNTATYSVPQVSYLNPYIDVSDPLITTQGNPELKSTWQNNTNLNFTTFNVARGLSFFSRLGFSYSDNDIVNYSFYDDAGKQFSTYENISGNKRLNFSTSLTKTYKWNGNKLDLAPSFSGNYSYRKGFIDATEFTNKIYTLSPRFRVNLNVKDVLNLRATYGINFSSSHYSNYRLDKTITARQNLSLRLTNYCFSKTLFFSNDFNFTRNSSIAADFSKNSYFWNSSVNYQFFKNQMMLKFSVNDLLNQRQNATRTIGDNFVEDREELILKRYFMLSLVVNLSSFGAKT
ncbi:TonB-dependent receptor [Kaistella palustris]|uniref:TonB-dependent receptor n=1 Tax=Kaistella palustris TaxID=493376 RepID=UPI00055207A6|nr:TonB-dependent receptor [Kaistella palustris]